MKPTLSLRQRLGMCWLMLALVLSPALGLVHQVVHGSGLPASTSTIHAQSAQPAAKHALDIIHALFSGHSKAECVLLDHVAMGHALLAKALPLLQALPAFFAAIEQPLQWAQQHAAPFHARGPPAGQKV